jgi:hypothetical protein
LRQLVQEVRTGGLFFQAELVKDADVFEFLLGRGESLGPFFKAG